MPSSRTLILCLATLVSSAATLRGADVPADLQRALDAAIEQYGKVVKEAEEKLLASFEKEIEFTRKRPLKAEARQEAIDALMTERTTFEQHGTIPFSPRMRVASINHIRALQQAARPVASAYDKVIQHHTKNKDDAAAVEVIAEKRKLLGTRWIGVWEWTTRSGRFTIKMYSDGSTNVSGRTWRFEKDNLVSVWKVAGGPTEGWIDTCIIDATGQTFTASNQRGARFTGRRVDLDPSSR